MADREGLGPRGAHSALVGEPPAQGRQHSAQLWVPGSTRKELVKIGGLLGSLPQPSPALAGLCCCHSVPLLEGPGCPFPVHGQHHLEFTEKEGLCWPV